MDTLSERKQRILKAVVDEYIDSASPISSGEIQAKHFDTISSATIRNELSALEEMGYLIQPHTSAGRIPSKKAYSLYVDRFLENKSLTKREVETIEKAFNKRFDKIEDIIKSTAKVISDVTNYTSVIVLSNISKVLLKEIKLVGLDGHTVLVVIITDSGIIRDKIITIEEEVNDAYIRDANAIINKIFMGKTVGQVKSPERQIKAELKEFKELYESIVSILKAYAETDEKNVVMEGQAKFLNSPDQNLDTAKDFLALIDNKERLGGLVAGDKEVDFSVKIGKDEAGGIEKCAIVTAKYRFNGTETGFAGVIGPERMDYNKVLSILKYISETVEDLN